MLKKTKIGDPNITRSEDYIIEYLDNLLYSLSLSLSLSVSVSPPNTTIEIQINSSSNLEVHKRGGYSKNKRKVDEDWTDRYTSLSNREVRSSAYAGTSLHNVDVDTTSGMEAAARNISLEQPHKTMENSKSLAFRPRVNNAESIHEKGKTKLQTQDDRPLLLNKEIYKEDKRHARMERSLKIAKKRKSSGNANCAEKYHRTLISDDKGTLINREKCDGRCQKYAMAAGSQQPLIPQAKARHARMERALKLANKKLNKVSQTQIGTNYTITSSKSTMDWTPMKDSRDGAKHVLICEPITDAKNNVPATMEGRTISYNSVDTNMPIQGAGDHSIFSSGRASQRTKSGKKTSQRANRHVNSGEQTNMDFAEYLHMGYAMYECEHCAALFWYDERSNKNYNTADPKFNLCCKGGQVQLPHLPEAPNVLYELLFNNTPKSKHFRDNIRSYNSMFQFTSMGAKIDRGLNTSRGPPTFTLFGENYHLMGSLIPPEGNVAKFAQLYVFDTLNEIKNRLAAIRGEDKKEIHEDIVRDLKKMLDERNVLVKAFRMVKDSVAKDSNTTVKLRLIGKREKDGRRYNLPSTDEVAALIVGDFDIDKTDRDIVVETQSGRLQRINQLNPAYLGLQYPLLFPFGEDGYKEDIPLNKRYQNGGKGRQEVSMREFFAFRIQERLFDGSPLLYSRRLFQQFLVDGYSMIESSRLNYIRLEQEKFRCEMYKGIKEAVLSGETTPSSRGKRIVLPSSFTGGPRYMIQNYQDAMAICKAVGYPDLFITFTCNPKWPEVEDFLKNRELNAEDRPDIVCRAFKAKLDILIKDIRANKIFGKVCAVVYTIEFQKRGLPHAHILLFLHKDDKYPTAEDIDKIISAEIPDKELDPEYYEAVEKHMMHGPCGMARKDSPCMENGKCIRRFPKRFVEYSTVDDDGYPVYRRREDGRTINKSGVDLDNRYVVPHNRLLLMRYGAHINVEWCNQSRSIKYLFKYVNNGHDRVTASFYKSATENADLDEHDEVSMYYDCRYISPCEAAWRIFGYNIHYRDPSVVRLGFHLPNEQNVVFKDHENLDDVLRETSVKESMFLGWFQANKDYTEARTLTYAELPTKFVWKAKERVWLPRKTHFVIGRIFYVPLGSGERYYLRLLLNFVKGPTSFEDIRTIDDVVYATFKDACYARGLLENEKEYIEAIEEASHWGSGTYLRKLFATLLFSNSMDTPEHVWQKTWTLLCDDILHRQRTLLDNSDLVLTEDELKELTLIEIEKILNSYNKSLRDFPPMSILDMSQLNNQVYVDGMNRLICDELRYDRRQLALDHASYMQQLTDEQRVVYEQVIQAVQSGKGGVFFLYGYGGTGKTFVWKTLASALRSRSQVVLTVASSGIASLLLPGGRTAHSRFAIPLNLDECSTCNIKQGSALADLLIKTKLIIWDEAPMVNRFCIEALDRTMRDILRFSNPNSLDQPFGGKTVVFGGDFRQILPVIPKGTRQEIVNATINSSYIWDSCKLLSLTKNMRLKAGDSHTNSSELKEFGDWILGIGDGSHGTPRDCGERIEIPEDILVKDWDDPIETICKVTYPELFCGKNIDEHIEDRAILAPTLQIVDEINNYMMSLNSTEAQTYYSSDKACPTESNNDLLASIHTPEFLNTIRCSGIPNHELTLKVGTPIMLLRNIDHFAGLCNGTRLVVTRLGKHIIEACSKVGKNKGQKVFIPRMTLSPSDHRIPFKFQRRQFPIMVSYAMTINKSQGQSLSKVGLLLKKPVFTHGQLYVAASRVTNRQGLKILLCHDANNRTETDNVVFKEVFRNVC
ncbi:uncharacterized protein LOC107606362 isoform X4 [Arachis ipaensis]|uniref:uncharacterized protein LOC107606362 isoform X4 n=1 Tax=Arachis ipaensis TaxID=130454 RepID=UPI000A2B8F83|nr:uncharacterized protein LOC107606362 isoform X4 [Arachis ipaensis]